ncbi:MAG TPA: sulfurtransferase [Thermodesulfobacteriota bacterium]|nr:sulfurtransferase [Thermodesulfobacteriota bacterium]
MERRKPYILTVGILISMVLFLPGLLPAKNAPSINLNYPRLVETRELFSLTGHPSIRIVDMRTSLLDYLKGHIPNAVYLHFENLQIPDKGIPDQAPDRICLERLLGENLSLSNSMGVVLYSERSNPNATLLAWTLDYLGHKKVGILNGGWEKWTSERRPVTQEYPPLLPNKFFGKVIRETLAEKKWMLPRLTAKNVVILDARPPRQYSGEEGEEIRKGHIPGARNLFWEMTLEGEEVRVWKNKEDLEKLLVDIGVTKDKEIIVYCRTGREASHLYFTLKYGLGFPKVHLYGGSWVEWSSDKTLPVKTGMDP